MSDPSQPAIDPALVARVKGILLQPHAEWARIDGEFATTKTLFTRYAMILAAIGPLCGLIGAQLMPLGLRLPITGAVIVAILSYLLSLAAVYVLGLIINALAPTFGGVSDPGQAMKVAVYSWTAAWLAGVFGLVPVLGVLTILGLYSFYLLYIGLPLLMKTPDDKKVGYFVVTLILTLIAFAIISAIVGTVSASLTVTSAMLGGLAGL